MKPLTMEAILRLRMRMLGRCRTPSFLVRLSQRNAKRLLTMLSKWEYSELVEYPSQWPYRLAIVAGISFCTHYQ